MSGMTKKKGGWGHAHPLAAMPHWFLIVAPAGDFPRAPRCAETNEKKNRRHIAHVNVPCSAASGLKSWPAAHGDKKYEKFQQISSHYVLPRNAVKAIPSAKQATNSL